MLKKNIILISIIGISVTIICYKSDSDGLYGFLFSRLFPEDTVYAQNYTEIQFQNITIGMTKKEVKEQIGEPLHILENQEMRLDNTLVIVDRWWYSESPKDTNYRIREIRFSKNTKGW